MGWWRDAPRTTRVLAVTAALALAIALGSLVVVSWMAADPRYWFPDAYAEQGPPGEQGPTGAEGPRGKPGPVGPGAQAAIADMQSGFDELQGSIEAVNSRVSDLEGGAAGSDLESLSSDLEQLRDDLNYWCEDMDRDLDQIYMTCYF